MLFMVVISDLSEKVVERLSLYRQLLQIYRFASSPHINSGDLSRLTGATQESVRRDLMLIGCQCFNLRQGYPVDDIIQRINQVLDPFDTCRMALVGNNDAFTETLLHEYENEKIRLVAVFDFMASSPALKREDVNHFNFDDLYQTVQNLDIRLVILNVPGDYTQQTAQILVKAGVKGIINLSRVGLQIPGIFVENINIVTAVEKAAFFMKWKQYV